jgi:hypothetical protein
METERNGNACERMWLCCRRRPGHECRAARSERAYVESGSPHPTLTAYCQHPQQR